MHIKYLTKLKNRDCLILFFFISLFFIKISIVAGNNILSFQEKGYTLTHFSGQNSIPGQSLQCIFEDSKGLLWLGIESVGLSKYNGKNHVVYSNNPNDSTSLSNNYPTKIIEDDLGYIWVATANGLNRLDRESGKFKQFFHDNTYNSINNNVVGTLLKDEYGNIWISTANGINIYNPYKDEFCRLFYNENEDEPANLNYIHSLYIKEDKSIWVGTAIQGLFKLDGNIYKELATRWEKEEIQNLKTIVEKLEKEKKVYKDKRTGDIRSIKSNNDTIWLATQNGLFFLENEKFTKIQFPKQNENLNNSTYYSILIDSHKTLWGSSTDNGIVVMDISSHPLKPSVISSKDESINNLKSNTIREIIESKSGLIWITTKFGGIYYFDRRQKTFPLVKETDNYRQGLSDGFVTSVIEDSERNIWIGTKNGGITKFNIQNQNYEYYTKTSEKNQLKTNRVECMLIDNDKNIWIGTDEGLAKKEYNKDGFKFFLNFHVRFLFEISDEYLWIGTENGLFRFSKTEEKLSPITTKHTDFFDKENNIAIKDIIYDRDSIYWIASGTSGIFEYHPKNDNLYNYLHDSNEPKSLCGNQVRALYLDKEDNLWVGTKSAGLCLFDREKEEFILKSNPSTLPSNTVYHILEDDNGLLWLGTHEGISSYNYKTEEFVNYSTLHGLQSPVFEINASLKTSSGRLIMGGNKGLNVFRPEKINIKSPASKMIISNFNIFNIPKAIDITENKHFKLDSKSNYISFEFALLDYSKPDENKYKYMLDPFDNEWIESGTRNFASYTNLPPGEYIFKVDAISNVGGNSSENIELSFMIKTPLWKRKWFIIALTIFIASTIFMIYRLKVISSKRRENDLKKLVQKRTEDLYAAYQKLSNFNKEVESQNKNLLQQRDQIAKQNIELEMHRTQLQSMVLERTKDLEKEKLKAQESDKLKSAFLANMSHEIRTPLNAILGFLDLMQTDNFTDEEKADMNKIIHQNSNDLLQLINDIIDISIIEANQVIINKVEVNLSAFIKDLVTVYCSTKNLMSNNVELTTVKPEGNDDFVIKTDPGRLKQIYINLINNAIKFTEEGYIKYGYTIEQEKNRIKCFVEDTGIGISMKNQALLFKRFNKIEPTLDKVHRGTGLGLSISKHLSELLGGSIHVKSEEGKGSIFYFYIPIK